jgi:hypothetical protein
MRANFSRGVLLLCAFVAGSAAAKPPAITCPDELAPSAIRVNGGAQWRPFVAYPLKLYSAGMSAGPPETLSQLRGVDLQRKGEPDKTLYELAGGGFEQGKWLDCNYGAAGEISISRRLDDKFSSCVVAHFARNPSERQRVEVMCK